MAIRRARWIVLLAIATQFVTAGAPPGPQLLSAPVAAAFFVGGLLFANALAYAEARTTDPVHVRRLALSQLTVDTVLAVAIYWAFLFEPMSPAWALLLPAVVEAAVRWRLRGALIVWMIGLVSMVAGELHMAAWLAGTEMSPQRVVMRAAIVLVVALACSSLAEGLTRRIQLERQANAAAERRAALLATVADAARRMSTLDASTVLARIVDAAIEIGFDAAEICLLDEAGRKWRSLHPQGLPGTREGADQPVDAGVAGLVFERRDTVVLDDYAVWEGALPDVAVLGFHKVVASPVWSGRDLAAVLTVGTGRTELLEEEREAIELLAAQASRALEIAHRYREREELQQQLTHQAFHDALTGLPNRSLFHDRLSQALSRTGREGLGLGLLFVDLDGFKLVNDTFGHHAGDELLIEVGARLTLSVRPGDTVARLGGDEFVVLIERLTRVGEAVQVAERVLAGIDSPVVLGGAETTVSASVGVSWMEPGADMSPDRLLQQADRAMYMAKQRGRGALVVYEARADLRHETRVRFEAALRRAIAEDSFDLHYQPMLSEDGERVVAVEALARWDHPTRGAVSPEEFMAVAERSGAILPLGRLLLRRALSQAARWSVLRNPPRLNLNVSFRQLADPGFAAVLGAALEEHRVSPRQLVLELTEATAVEDSPGLLRAIGAVQALGVALAVDDFGRGFSSLRYLRDLPVQEVKLDRSLVVGAATTPEDRAIVRWTAQLAHELGMRVTAEGVETDEQLRAVRELGVDMVQGYLLHQPMPVAQLDAVLGLPASCPDRSRPFGATAV